MPPFPDRESSLLAKLYQTAPWTTKLHQEEGERVGRGGRGGGEGGGTIHESYHIQDAGQS